MEETGINVLSLFDGISCGQVALERAGIKINQYYASEIDKYVIQIAQKQYQKTIQLGCVKDIQIKELPKIDLLIGGSPCQGFSVAGKGLNFEDPRSKLFFEFVRILEELKPKYFLLENVRMKKEFQDIISRYLGVEPIMIDSNLLCAQNRKRLYWTNIPKVTQPEDKGILLKDIVHENFNEILNDVDIENFNINPSGKGMNGNVYCINKDKSSARTTNKGEGQKIAIPLSKYIVPFDKTLQILNKEVDKGKVGYFRKDSQANRVYFIHDKAITLTGSSGGGAAKMGQYLFGSINKSKDGSYKINIPEEVKVRKYKVDIDALKSLLKNKKHDSKYTLKEIADILKIQKTKVEHWFRQDNSFAIPDENIWLKLKDLLNIETTEFDKSIMEYLIREGVFDTTKRVYFTEGKSPTLTSANCDKKIFGCITPDRVNKRQNGQRFNEGKKFYTLTAQDRHGVLIEGYIRKLTPIECERLQTLPDNYTEGISNAQRYKALGNGWTVDVLAHIFRGLKRS